MRVCVCVQVYTAESIWHAEAARAEGALKALEDTRADMEAQLAKVRVCVQVMLALCERYCEARRLIAS